MPETPELDLVVTNALVVRAGEEEPQRLDVGISDGRFVAIEESIDPARAAEVLDAAGKPMFPGVVDVHQHWGIYNELSEDAVSESRAAAQGGVTSGITYIRTGAYYLNRTGPYREIFPDVLSAVEGRAYVDYAFHVAPILEEHIDEIPTMIEEFGVPSFKIFMFYGAHGLHGRSNDQGSFLMIPEDQSYDIAHFEFVMRGVQKARQDERFAKDRDHISLSLHCETAEIMRAYTKLVEAEGTLKGLEAYSAARPPHSEGLAITIASYLAHETELPNINLLHLSSRKAIEAAMMMAATFPHIDFRREVTVGHLLADCETANLGGKVNPPLRPREDVEALWEHVLAGDFSWVTSDHACCKDETKFGDPRDDVFVAKSGFGGTEYLLPGLVSEGRKRGLSYPRIAELVSRNPADRFGLAQQGRHRRRAGRGLLPRRRRRRVRRTRRGVAVVAGVHPVRGLRADRPGHRHLPARRARVAWRRRRRATPADSSYGAPATEPGQARESVSWASRRTAASTRRPSSSRVTPPPAASARAISLRARSRVSGSGASTSLMVGTWSGCTAVRERKPRSTRWRVGLANASRSRKSVDVGATGAASPAAAACCTISSRSASTAASVPGVRRTRRSASRSTSPTPNERTRGRRASVGRATSVAAVSTRATTPSRFHTALGLEPRQLVVGLRQDIGRGLRHQEPVNGRVHSGLQVLGEELGTDADPDLRTGSSWSGLQPQPQLLTRLGLVRQRDGVLEVDHDGIRLAGVGLREQVGSRRRHVEERSWQRCRRHGRGHRAPPGRSRSVIASAAATTCRACVWWRSSTSAE